MEWPKPFYLLLEITFVGHLVTVSLSPTYLHLRLDTPTEHQKLYTPSLRRPPSMQKRGAQHLSSVEHLLPSVPDNTGRL